MIIFFNNQPITKDVKIAKLYERAKSLYGSDYFSLQDEKWLGDNLTIESLFPNWILKEYNSRPNSVLVVPLIKNYLRWLLSIEYGYGAQLEWEYLRTPLYTNSIFLEAYSDFYFPGADFSQSQLSTILPNIRKFAVNAENNYFNVKGTPAAIKYCICNLLGFAWDDVDVITANAAVIEISVPSAQYNNLMSYQSFLEQHVIPAGMSIIYKAV